MIYSLKKYINKYFNKLKGRNDTLNTYELKLSILDKLDPEKFKNFNNKENSILYIRSIYKNIIIYNSKLKEIISYLSKDKVIYNGWCLELEMTIQINNFFLTDNLQYIEEIKYINEFKLLSIVFLSFYYEHSPLVAVGEHNTRVLSNFTNGLLNTIEDLVSITKK